MKRILAVVCCLSLCSIAVLAQRRAAREQTFRDQKFVNFVAQTDMVDANLSQLAEAEGASQPVKDCAQMLVSDHTSDYNKISDLAYKAGLRVPRAIDVENNRTTIGPLHSLKGTAFDRRYVREMIAEHAKAIAIYRKEAADAETPALRSYADKTLPELKKLLVEAKEVERAKAS